MTPSDVFPAFRLAFAQLPSGKFLGILLLALIITLVVTGPFLLIIASLAALIDWIPMPAFLSGGGSWLGSSTSWFWRHIMSPLAVVIIGVLLEPIVEAVESRHYPTLPKVRRRGSGEVIAYALRFLGLMILISIGTWLIAWLTPLPGWLVFTLASGYLIAREYFETVALRRMKPDQAKAQTNSNFGPLWIAGCVLALTLNIPLLNLISPLIGVAAFTHLFHAGTQPT